MPAGKELLHRITKDIAAGNHRWSARENRMLYVPEHARRRHLGYEPGTGELALEVRESIVQDHSVAGLARAVDWRARNGKNWLTRVKQQGACASCVAFATVAAIESLVRIARNAPIGDPAGATLPLLSEAQLFYCSIPDSPHSCHSAWNVTGALEYCTKTGLAPASDFPYTAGDQACRLAAGWQDRVTKLSRWQTVSTAMTMKAWLMHMGPLISVFSLYDDFLGYSHGVYARTENAILEGGHCVAVVGYDDAQRAWICKNSFADDWGMAGYCLIEYGTCGIDATMWGPAEFASIYPPT